MIRSINMVYEDIQDQNDQRKKYQPQKLQELNFAPIENRMLAVIFDYLFFTPLVGLLLAFLFMDSYHLIQINQLEKDQLFLLKNIKFELYFFGLLYFGILQSLFIYLTGTTPGHKIFKLKLNYNNKKQNYLIRILFRQWMHVFSVLLLGLPYLAVLFDKRSKAFYDKMLDVSISSSIQTVPIIQFSEADKKYLSTGYSIIGSMVMFMILLSVVLNHKEKVISFKLALNSKKNEIVNKSCVADLKMSDSNKTKSALILNIADQVDQNCVLEQADQILNASQITNEKEIELAYMAKWYIYQKEAHQPDVTEKYFLKMCETSQFSECQNKKSRQLANTESDSIDQKLLKFLKDSE